MQVQQDWLLVGKMPQSQPSTINSNSKAEEKKNCEKQRKIEKTKKKT